MIQPWLHASAVSDRVKFTGAVSAHRAAAILADADLYLATSIFESFGMASAEALATGLPLIGFASGDLRYWLAEDPGCRLVDVADYDSFAGYLAGWLRRDRESLPVPAIPALPSTSWEQTTDALLAALGIESA